MDSDKQAVSSIWARTRRTGGPGRAEPLTQLRFGRVRVPYRERVFFDHVRHVVRERPAVASPDHAPPDAGGGLDNPVSFENLERTTDRVT